MIGDRQDALVFYSALTFRSLLDALARPGKIVQLAPPAFLGEVPTYHSQATSTDKNMNAYALGALLSLLDRETSFIVAANNRWLPQTDPAVQWIALRSGSNETAPDLAAFALFCDKSGGELARQLSPGTLLEPELSATVIYCIEQLASSSEEVSLSKDLLTLELQGPGIEKTHTIKVAGLGEAQLNEIVLTRRGYPLGIDVYLVDGSGRCVGLPRTTHIRRIGQDD